MNFEVRNQPKIYGDLVVKARVLLACWRLQSIPQDQNGWFLVRLLYML